jgi:hypothetical protein
LRRKKTKELKDNGDPQAFEEKEDAEEDKGADKTFFGGEEPDPPDNGEDDIASERNRQPSEEYTIEENRSEHDNASGRDAHGDKGEEHQKDTEELPRRRHIGSQRTKDRGTG